MASAASEKLASPDIQLDALSMKVQGNNNVNQFRRELALVADQAFQNKFINEEAHKGLHDVASGKLLGQDDQAILGSLKFQRDDFKKAQDIVKKMDGYLIGAVRDGFASEGDRDFLMQHLILTGDFNLTEKAGELEDKVKEKIKNMRKDREAYDKIANHNLVKNTGFLKVDAHTKIAIPDEKAFLNMTVPERRALLKKAEEALPKAEAYAEVADEVESADLIKQYDSALHDAQHKEKIIGSKTAKKFREGFKVIDVAEKQHWILEFQAQMQRYRTLWGSVRESLRGPALQAMENQRERMGYTELFAEFGRVKARESVQLCLNYDRKLSELHAQKVISKHTFNAFSADIRQKDLKDQYHYADELENQMQRYKALRTSIDALPDKKAQKELNALYESSDFGYSEINQRFLELSGQADSDGPDSFAQKVRSLGLADDNFAKNIVWNMDYLNDDEARRLLYRVRQIRRRHSESEYNSKDYGGDVQEAVAERQAFLEDQQSDSSGSNQIDMQSKIRARRKIAEEKQVETEEASDDSGSLLGKVRSFFGRSSAEKEDVSSKKSDSVAEARRQNRDLERMSNSGIKVRTEAEDAFNMTTVTTGKRQKKVVRFGIGDKKATKAFLQEDFNMEADEITAVAKDGDIKRRLDMRALLAWEKELEAKLNKKAS